MSIRFAVRSSPFGYPAETGGAPRIMARPVAGNAGEVSAQIPGARITSAGDRLRLGLVWIAMAAVLALTLTPRGTFDFLSANPAAAWHNEPPSDW